MALLDEKTGFRSRDILAVELPLALDWKQSVLTFEQKISPPLRKIPGVVSVAAVNSGPMMLHSSDLSRFTRAFSRVKTDANPPMAQVRWTTPEYFSTLGIRLTQGRLFTNSDIERPGYIINEALARKYFHKENPVGQKLWKNIGGPSPSAVPIIGVVGDVRDLGLDHAPVPTLYELGVSNWMTLLIRSNVSTSSLTSVVRSTIRSISPDDAITTIAPLDQVIQNSVDRSRSELRLVGIFAVLAGLLTTVGVFGVVTYSLSHRKPEFAVRLALGAAPLDICMLALRRFAPPTITGLSAGAWFASLFAYALRTQLHKVAPQTRWSSLAQRILC